MRQQKRTGNIAQMNGLVSNGCKSTVQRGELRMQVSKGNEDAELG